jgi:hypothetical protein
MSGWIVAGVPPLSSLPPEGRILLPAIVVRRAKFDLANLEGHVFRFEAGKKFQFYDKIGESSSCQSGDTF